jgi:hypothetical protein
MKIIITVILVLLTTVAGGATAFFLSSGASTAGNVSSNVPAKLAEPEYASLTREFVVPIIREDRVRGHIVLTLGVHSSTLPRDQILRLEPVFRDRFLEALFRYASIGGFDRDFTNASTLNQLRLSLNDAAGAVVSPNDATVLILSIDRREL